MKISFIYLILLLVISCKEDKKPILLADREAPLGWIYLKMYDDYTFDFISRGAMRDEDVYSGNFNIKNDTVYFKYKDSIPQAGSKAVIQNGFVSYLDGKYRESVEIKLKNIKK
ncbi:hypothetical protein CHRY9390_00200 [Chryseobacterium aquaeductus]|uniref:Lipoprotein n=1 Tax=Chryseobacterium aquaeductus TaxID=2675056 RepID=A0A9N8QPJ2_9FLAO|nr:hypothetical protein [Chryseobacterium aquaeductus]CAA7329561.1 hypothetical protein CHRY9390_00200 [Chryseobacterium potabilaquae]CAD7797625.1 hypothetical protein CHRY9390_00200 [Chryseobacterium aquaeductus]